MALADSFPGEESEIMEVVESFADSLPVHLMLLDGDRRIVYANARLEGLVGDAGIATALHKRPGEALCCCHAREKPGGCGCSDHCGVCGAFMAIRAAMQGRRAVQECRMTTLSGDSLDFRVWANPILIGESRYTSFSLLDISDEKRREKLERTFFHDMMNMASGIYGMMEVIDMTHDDAEQCARNLDMAKKCALHLTGEIRAALALTRAEERTLAVAPGAFRVSALLESVAGFFRIHTVTGAVHLETKLTGSDREIVSDESLLVRVLVNLVMNAIEAGESGAHVRLEADLSDSAVVFAVHSAAPIDDFVSKQLFERSFSTKGRGRGTGTYSARLFTEKYLGGRIWFETSPESGTTFFVRIPTWLESRPACEKAAERTEAPASAEPVRSDA